MELCVPVAESAQDGHGIAVRRLTHRDGLESPLERRILLDVLAVFVERGRTDDVQFAAGKLGLEDVARIHRTLAAAATCTDDGVQFVDEDDQRAVLRGDLVEHRGEALLEVAAIAGTGHHRGQVQLDDALVAQSVRDIAVHDALGQALDDRSLADAGLAHEHRIVLGATREDFDGLLDLVGTADDGVHPAVSSTVGEVDAVLVEGRCRGFGLRRRCGSRLECCLQRLRGDTQRREQTTRRAGLVCREREEQMFRVDVCGAECT